MASQEEWDRITIGEINALFLSLPTVMQRCIAVGEVIIFMVKQIMSVILWTRV
jgi:hypothetical protein